MRCSLFTSVPPPSSIRPSSPHRLSISDTRLRAHPREATLATTRSLEERRRTGVRILIYIYAPLSTVQLRPSALPSTTTCFIFSNNIQLKKKATALEWMHLGVWWCGWWRHYVLSGSLDRKLYPKRAGAKNTSKHRNFIKGCLAVLWKKRNVIIIGFLFIRCMK